MSQRELDERCLAVDDVDLFVKDTGLAVSTGLAFSQSCLVLDEDALAAASADGDEAVLLAPGIASIDSLDVVLCCTGLLLDLSGSIVATTRIQKETRPSR